jgi:NADH dehydrogenase
MRDVPALRGALQDVDCVVHLVGEEAPQGEWALEEHPTETACLVAAMQQEQTPRIVYVSRLGADSASAYPLFRIRGEAESLVLQSGIEYILLQPTITYGAGDAFTNVIALLAKSIPMILPIPDPGLARFQPLWVGDLARCVAAAVDRADLVGAGVAIGGPEHFTLEQMVSEILTVLQVRRMTIHVRMPFVRGASSLLGTLFARNPVPLWMLDLVEKGSATALGAIPRTFGFEPIRFSHGLDYLRRNRPWRRELVRFLLDPRQ